MTKKRWDIGKDYQVTWEDLEPWVQQLHEEHGILVSCTVQLEGLSSGLRPCVRVVGRRWRVGSTYDDVFEQYAVFDLRNRGEVEKHVLHILSCTLLALDSDKERAERETARLFA